MNVSNQLPPHSDDAERGALGCLITATPELRAEMLESEQRPEPPEFYDGRHSGIFSAVCDMHRARRAVDEGTLAVWLGERNLLEEFGGRSYLATIADAPRSGSLENFIAFAESVRSLARRREALRDALEMAESARNGPMGGALELAIPEAGPFPADALPPTVRALVEGLADLHQMPIELPGMAALAVVAGACGKGWKLTGAVQGKSNFANIYIFPVAERGIGKGCLSILPEPFFAESRDRSRQWRENEKPRLVGQSSILAKRLDDAIKLAARETGDVERREAEIDVSNLQVELARIERDLEGEPSLWAENVTSEKLAVLMSASSDESLMIYSAEAADVLRIAAGRYRGDQKSDFDLMLKGYSCESCKVDRMGRPSIELEEPCLSMCLMVQPCVIREWFAMPDVIQRGFAARTMAFIAPGELREDDGLPRNLGTGLLEGWNDLISGILTVRGQRQKPVMVTASPEAAKVLLDFNNWSVRLRKGPMAKISHDLGRWRENACRVALALHIAENPNSTVLNAETADCAVRLVRWAGLQTVGLLASGIAKTVRDRAEKLRNHLASGEKTLNKLAKNHSFDESETRSLAASFPDVFEIQEKPSGPKGGRPSAVIRLRGR
jgi:hypothetical protein